MWLLAANPLLGLSIKLLGQPGGCTNCCQLPRPLPVFFRNKQACPLTSDPAIGLVACLSACLFTSYSWLSRAQADFLVSSFLFQHDYDMSASVREYSLLLSMEWLNNQHVLHSLAQMQRCVMEKRRLHILQ